MNSAKLLIIGKNGYLGSHLFHSKRLRDSFAIIGTSRTSGLSLDLAQPDTFEEVRKYIQTQLPRYMVIAAAITDVEKCARDPEATSAVNIHGTLSLLEIARDYGVIPVFFSTDYTLKPANAPQLLIEDAPCEPLTEYGRQKRVVEEWISSRFPRHLILRTSKLMSLESHPKNIISQAVRVLKSEKKIHAFVDQWITPVFLEDIAEVLAHPEMSQLSGVYHLATKTVYSRYELARLIKNQLDLKEGYEVIPSKMAEFKTLERRPMYNTLNSDKICSAIGIRFREISEIPHFSNF